MCATLKICSKFNRNLVRNLFVEKCFFVYKCKTNKNSTDRVNNKHGIFILPVFLPQPIRLYSIDTNNIHNNESWYTSDETQSTRKKRSDQWKRMKIVLIAMCIGFGVCSVYLLYVFGSPNLDETGNPIEDEFSSLPLALQFFRRMIKELETVKRLIYQPLPQKLLPDPPVYPYYQPTYTLVLEMSDLLLHPDWTFQTGWRFKKRPGVDKFLESVTVPTFELVVFTGEQSTNTFPILDALDPNGFIMHRLTRDSTEYVNGVYVKNLDYLNRDLSKVIVVDWNKNSVKFHRENTILIPRWNGQDDDTMLADLAVFLKAIASSDVKDVREILSEYMLYDNPVEAFRENQRKLIEEVEKEEELARSKGTNFASRWANTFLKMNRT